MADLSDTIAQAAADPAVFEVDGQHSETQDLRALIAADQYLAARASIRKRNRGIYFSKILPAGPVSDQGGSQLGSFDRGGGS